MEINTKETSKDLLIGFKINSKGFGTIPKLLMQDRNLCIGAKGLYSYFCSYTGGGNTCFPSRKKICFDLCISVDTFGKYLKQLSENGYLKCEQIKENGRFSHNVYTLCDTILPCPKISDTEFPVYEKTDTNKNNNNKNNNKESKKEKKESISEKPTPKKERRTYNQVIEEYTDNENLRTELKEFLKVLKLKNSLPTNYSLDTMLNNLSSLAYSDEAKIAIVKQSIIKSWKDFYPINHLPYYTNKQTSECEPSYDLSDYESDDILEMYVNPD